MKGFATAREAKEFLVNQIVAEARRENVPLSEVEAKMLYLSYSAWTPEMAEVDNDFDREYDSAEYEKKVTDLICNFYVYANAEDREAIESWREAVRKIENEDHYLLIMIGEAGLSWRPRGDVWKLLATALIIVGVIIAIIVFATR